MFITTLTLAKIQFKPKTFVLLLHIWYFTNVNKHLMKNVTMMQHVIIRNNIKGRFQTQIKERSFKQKGLLNQ